MGAARALAVAAVLLVSPSPPTEAEPLALWVTQAAVDKDFSGGPVLVLTFSEQSAKDFAELTTKNVGKNIELRIDGSIVVTPRVNEPILGGYVMVMGADEAEYRAIADRISSGAKVEVEAKPD